MDYRILNKISNSTANVLVSTVHLLCEVYILFTILNAAQHNDDALRFAH